jgi:hypothetical protein
MSNRTDFENVATEVMEYFFGNASRPNYTMRSWLGRRPRTRNSAPP